MGRALPSMAFGHGMPCPYCGNGKSEKNDALRVPDIVISLCCCAGTGDILTSACRRGLCYWKANH
jgi:hypothetical protein